VNLARAIPEGRVSAELRDLSTVATALGRALRLRDIRTGKWLGRMLTAYLAVREDRLDHLEAPADARERGRAAESVVRRAALLSALAGAGSAGSVTAATVATSETGGWAGPFVLPVAALAVASETLLRSIVHLDMACDLGELHGLHFPPGSERELLGAYALAFGAEGHETEDDPGRGLVERMIGYQESGGPDKLMASRMVSESLLRSAVPFADVAISSIVNWRLTQRVGRFMEGYVPPRLALGKAVQALREKSPESVDLLAEGIWFVFIADGRLTGVETALLTHLLRRHESPSSLFARFVRDESDWLRRLRHMTPDPLARDLLLEGLEIAAGSDGLIEPSEIALVRDAAHALGKPFDPERLAARAREFELGSGAYGSSRSAGGPVTRAGAP